MEMLLGLLKSVVEMYSQYIPQWAVGILLLIASARLVLKPAFALAYAVAALTPSPKDDAKVKQIEDGKIVKALKFGLDWLASIKFPEKKK